MVDNHSLDKPMPIETETKEGTRKHNRKRGKGVGGRKEGMKGGRKEGRIRKFNWKGGKGWNVDFGIFRKQ